MVEKIPEADYKSAVSTINPTSDCNSWNLSAIPDLPKPTERKRARASMILLKDLERMRLPMILQ